MEYSSSEDDELIDDYVDIEDEIPISDVDQHSNEVTVPLHFLEHGENSIGTVDSTIGTDLLSTDVDVKNLDPYLGMEFVSDSAAREFYNAYALRLGFGIRVARSRTEKRKGVEVVVMKRFVCLKEGHHKKKVTDYTTKKKRKRLSIRDGCPAMMEVVQRGPEKWVVTKLVLDHTHVVVSPERIREIQFSRLTGKEREHDNYLREMRQKVFGEGDAQGLLEFLRKAQATNSGFFYAMQVDSRNCVTNVFWADIRARMAYTYFGDAVTFDTSYRKNEKMLPFATFAGVNHHCQPVNFGCALVIDKTQSSFTWLFETWLSAMSGRQPLSFTTDQGNAMGAAVAKVFPNTQHRLCKWHILSRCKKKLPNPMAATAASSLPHLRLRNHHHHCRLPPLSRPTSLSLSRPNPTPEAHIKRWALQSSSSSLVEQSQSQSQDLQDLVNFLYDDLPHLFDDRGIDPSMYDDSVEFRDPITKHDTIFGYLFNIKLLKNLFNPQFELHSVRQTGPFEITTRWTMVMTFALLPWKPQLVFTGISIMGVNPRTRKFCSHLDIWDSIANNDYFSLEGFLDVLKQLRIYKTPDLESPKFRILKRTATYEVRSYEPFLVAETKGDKLSGSSGFRDVTGYIFGKNSAAERIPMTTPVFTQAVDDERSEVSIQIVLPKSKELDNLPAPTTEAVKLRSVEGGIAAAVKFSGKTTEELVRSKEKELRSSLLKDGLKPRQGCLLARYNDPGRTWSSVMRNEVLIWLDDFTLE